MSTAHHLSRIKRLEHRVHELENLIKKHGLQPITIENFINQFSKTAGERRFAGKPVSAPDIVKLAATHGFTFKATSVSAYLCKMVTWGLAIKEERRQTFHTYIIK